MSRLLSVIHPHPEHGSVEMGASILAKYYGERFKLVPWFLYPFVLAAFERGRVDASFFFSTAYFLVGLLFYRLYDDVMTEPYDRRATPFGRRYLRSTPKLRRLIVLPLVLYLIVTGFYLGRNAVGLTVLFISVQALFYVSLQGKRASKWVFLVAPFAFTVAFLFSLF